MVEVLINNEQFFIVVMFLFWTYLIALALEQNKFVFYVFQFVAQFPLSILFLAIAYLQGIPYGYVIGSIILLLSTYLIVIGFKEG